MPIRLLCWNIENFALNKIADGSRKRQPGSTLPRSVAAVDRLNYILDHVALPPSPPPDVFAVIEVETAFDGNGRLARGAGLDGAYTLLGEIRDQLGNHWCLVPPIQTGPTEAVGVYYNSQKLVFTGPNIWTGGLIGTSQPSNSAVPGAYPTAIAAGLPNRAVPAGALQNVGTAENQCAAQTRFTYCAGAGMLAGQPINLDFLRAPYMVSFAEIDGGSTVQRNLTFYIIHSPAAGWFAENYLLRIAQMAEVVDNQHASEVRIVAGDFNVNLMKDDWTEADAYTQFQQNSGFTAALRPVSPAPVGANGYKGYYATHVKPTDYSVYWSTQDETTYYPGFGYVGALFVHNLYAIDNVFARYGSSVTPPTSNNCTIMNGFVGTPFRTVWPPPGGAPPGSLSFSVEMPYFSPVPAQGAPYSPGIRAALHGWDNYGHIRSTSDHLAIAVDL